MKASLAAGTVAARWIETTPESHYYRITQVKDGLPMFCVGKFVAVPTMPADEAKAPRKVLAQAVSFCLEPISTWIFVFDVCAEESELPSAESPQVGG